MRKTIFILLTMLTTFFNSFAAGETTKTSFKVWGNCEQCKKRIEKAAKTEGVKSAVWDVDKKIMTVTFVPSTISADQIQQNIAKVGYDTQKFKGNDSAYNKLPHCCQYDRAK